MNDENIEDIDENIEDIKESSTREELKAIGQMIAGELELVGGILTADPISQAEGEYNVEAGQLKLEDTDALIGSQTEETDKENQAD